MRDPGWVKIRIRDPGSATLEKISALFPEFSKILWNGSKPLTFTLRRLNGLLPFLILFMNYKLYSKVPVPGRVNI
jgi:hypothetical protein